MRIPGFILDEKQPTESYWREHLKHFRGLYAKATPYLKEYYKQQIKRVCKNIYDLKNKKVS